MRNFIIVLFGLMIGYFSGITYGADAPINGGITLPASKLNGDPLTPADIHQINIYYGSQDPGATGDRIVIPGAPTSFQIDIPVIPSPDPQTIYLRASVVGVDPLDPLLPGLESGVSGLVMWTGVIDTDSPPGLPVLAPFTLNCVPPLTCTLSQ